jgi:hypothetical protein
MSLINIRYKLLVLAGIASSVGFTAIGSPLEETTSTLEEWVQTERLISEEKSSWEAEKASMENLLSVYRQEIETLGKLIEDAEADTSAAEVRRADLLEQDQSVKVIESKAVDALIEAETQVKRLESLLPPPLREELQPLFNNIPEDPKASKLAIGQRIQPVVAILTQVQKFNQVVTVVEDFREFEAGRTVQTETVFFGLGAAYYVDQANENAGVGIPTADGWEWKQDNSLIAAVRGFVDIYRGKQQARYIEVPVGVH